MTTDQNYKDHEQKAHEVRMHLLNKILEARNGTSALHYAEAWAWTVRADQSHGGSSTVKTG